MSIIISPAGPAIPPADTSTDAELALRLQNEELGLARNSHPPQPPRPNLPRVRGPEWIVPTNPLYYLFWRSGIHHEPVLFVIMAPQVYALGMIGYAFAVVVRVIEVASAAISFLKHLLSFVFTCGTKTSFEELWKVTTYFFGRIAELISGVIGLACPLIAYVCDESIHKCEALRPESFLEAFARQQRERWEASVRAGVQKYADNGEKARKEMSYEFGIFQRAAGLIATKLNTTIADLEIGTNEEQNKLARLAFFILLMEKNTDSTKPGLNNIRQTLADKIKSEKDKTEKTPINLDDFDTQAALVASFLSTNSEDPNALLERITKSIVDDETSDLISALKQTEQIFFSGNRDIWAGMVRVHIGVA